MLFHRANSFGAPIEYNESQTLSISCRCAMRIQLLTLGLLILLGGSTLWAQRGRKPQRAEPPKFSGKEFEGTFFADVTKALQGARPTGKEAAPAMVATPAASGNTKSAGDQAAATDAMAWSKLISGPNIEDLVKNSKLRLDPIVASSTKFAGGYKEARREFSLQALMFAVIEQYPGDVRWKKSAGVARESLARMAAAAKVSSPQAHKEAKQRVQDLADLLSGNTLEGKPSSELSWADVIDRVPMMQLLEWAQQDYINPHSASQEKFAANKEELQRYAELVAVLGKAAIMNGMPDAEDAEYRAIAGQMIDQAKQISVAVQTDNADLARQAAGQVSQACSKCHDGYR